jgi:hypothetical protein
MRYFFIIFSHYNKKRGKNKLEKDRKTKTPNGNSGNNQINTEKANL